MSGNRTNHGAPFWRNASTRTALQRWSITALVALAFLYWLPALFTPLSLFHDDSIYLVTARSLAHGHGYRIESIPGSPYQTKYPALYPLCLAVMWRAMPGFPANTALFRLFNLVCIACALGIGCRLLKRHRLLSASAIAGVLIWCASYPANRAFGGLMMTESLAALLVALTVYAGEEAAAAPGARRAAGWAFCAGASAGLALLCRSSLLLLAPAAALALLPRWRRSVAALSGSLPAAGWWLASVIRAHRISGGNLLAYYLSYDSWYREQIRAGTARPAAVARANLADLLLRDLPRAVLCGFARVLSAAQPRGGIWLLEPLYLAMDALLVMGGVELWRRGYRAIPAVLLAAILPLLIFPADAGRYVFPVTFLCVVLALFGALQLIARFHPLPPAWRPWLLAGIAVGPVVNVVLAHWSVGGGPPLAWRAAAGWVRVYVPRDGAVCSSEDPLLYLATGRKGISDRCYTALHYRSGYFYWTGSTICPHPNQQAREYRRLGIGWFLEVGDPTHQPYGAPMLVQARPQWFQLVEANALFHVWKWSKSAPG